MKLRLLAGGVAAVLGSVSALAAPAIVVTARSGEPGAPERLADGVADRAANTLAVDAAGNTYVVGSRQTAGGWRYNTTKYAPDGAVLWNATLPAQAGAGELPYAVGVDAAGNVYVTGTPYTRYVTIKYDSAGTQQWERSYSVAGGLYQQPRAMAVDAAGNVYVTGRSQAGGISIDHFDYGTVKYDTDGNELWTARYNGPAGLGDEVTALALDADGNVYVTGTSSAGAQQTQGATVKYNAAGVQQWVALQGVAVGNKVNAIVVNGGSVVVTGQSNVGGEYDAQTVAYDRATGVEQWSSRLGGSSHFGDMGSAITRDAQGNLYIAGSIWDASNGMLVAKYDSAGTLQWSRNYQPYAGISGSNQAYSIARDPTGGVVAAGRAIGVGGFDYGVVKYDDAGNRQWSQLYNGAPGTLDDQAGTVAVRHDGVVVAAGTEAFTNGSGNTDRRTTLFIVDGVQATTPRITIAPSVAGQPYAVNVSVRGKVGFPAGSVLVTDSDGHSCGIALTNGDGACTLSNATAGGKTINAAFSPDTPTLFAASQGSATHTVDKATTRLTLVTPGLSRPGDAFDAEVDFGVVAPGAGTPSGSIAIGDGVDSCTATPPATRCALTLTTPGARTISAHYAGDANYLAATASAAHRVNRAPVATADSYTLREDGSLAIDAAAGVLANDSDGDADPLGVTPGTLQADGIGGTVVLRADGSFDYTAPADANGTATFAYTIGDGAETASGSVSVVVRPVNDPPSIAIGANRTHAAATTGTQTVAGFVTPTGLGPPDEAGQSLAAVLADVDSDANGVLDSVAVATNGTLTYALSGRGGTATVSVRARDDGGTTDGGNDTSAPHTFTITVASGVDLAVSVDNGRRFLAGGSAVNYTVDVRNLGPDTAHAALVTIGRPGNLGDWSWTCSRSDASPCAVASGNGAVSQTLDVPVGVVVTFRIAATVTALPELPVALNASVIAGAAQTDVQPSNDSAHDTDPVGIFGDGFDG